MVAYSFKKRFVDPIRVGLSSVSLSFDCQPKRQTIRSIGKRRHARPGETLQLYTAMRTKQCRKIGDARCMGVEGVLLKWSEWPAFMTYDIGEREPRVWRRVGNIRPILRYYGANATRLALGSRHHQDGGHVPNQRLQNGLYSRGAC